MMKSFLRYRINAPFCVIVLKYGLLMIILFFKNPLQQHSFIFTDCKHIVTNEYIPRWINFKRVLHGLSKASVKLTGKDMAGIRKDIWEKSFYLHLSYLLKIIKIENISVKFWKLKCSICWGIFWYGGLFVLLVGLV